MSQRINNPAILNNSTGVLAAAYSVSKASTNGKIVVFNTIEVKASFSDTGFKYPSDTLYDLRNKYDPLLIAFATPAEVKAVRMSDVWYGCCGFSRGAVARVSTCLR